MSTLNRLFLLPISQGFCEMEGAISSTRKAPLEAIKQEYTRRIDVVVQSLIGALSLPAVSARSFLIQELASLPYPSALAQSEKVEEVRSIALSTRQMIASVLSRIELSELELVRADFNERIKTQGSDRVCARNLLSVVVDLALIPKMGEGENKERALAELIYRLAEAKDFDAAEPLVTMLPEGERRNQALCRLSRSYAEYKLFQKAEQCAESIQPHSPFYSSAFWYLSEKLAEYKQFDWAIRLTSRLPTPDTKDALFIRIIKKVADDGQFQWAISMTRTLCYEGFVSEALQHIVEELGRRFEWVWAINIAETIPLEHIQAQTFLTLIEQMLHRGLLKEASELLPRITSEEQRSKAILAIVKKRSGLGEEGKALALALAETIPLNEIRLAAIKFVLIGDDEPERGSRPVKHAIHFVNSYLE